MSDTPELTLDALLGELETLEDEALKGPWQWCGNTATGQVMLATVDRGRIFVLMPSVEQVRRLGDPDRRHDFEADLRLQPRLHTGHGMLSYRKFAIYDVCPDAVGKPDDERVYRHDFTGLDHPDAKILVAARNILPTLLKIIRIQQKALRDYSQAQESTAYDSDGEEITVYNATAAPACAARDEVEKVIRGEGS